MSPPRSATLVGRDAELEQLCLRLGIRAPEEPAEGVARAVLLAGDAGVGKTRLLTELRDLAVARGWRVVVGHCLAFADSALPYLPFSEILGTLDAQAPDVVAGTLERHPALSRLQPGRRELAAGSGEGAMEPRALFDAVPALLEDVAGLGPLLVVVEDLHWADRSTLDLLSLLFARPFTGRIAVVASYRSDDLHRRHPLRRQVAEWARLREVERLQLEPLTSDDVRRLVLLLHPAPLPEQEIAAIVARAEGNAFFVEELVGAAGSALPEDLAGVLLVRLDRLDPDAREVVRAAAAAGRRVAHELVAAATGLAPGVLDPALRAAVDGNVLEAVHGDSYAFRHALLAEAVYDDLLPGERVRLHTAYAQALASGRFAGAAAELARHARLAGDLDTAVRASVDAGDQAGAVGGPGEAAQHYLAALTLLDQGAEGSDIDVPSLVARAADALMSSGHAPKAVRVVHEHLDRLPADAPADERGQLLAALAQGLLVVDSDEDAAERSAEAVALLVDGPPRQRAKALALHARILAAWGRVDEARQAGVEALTLAEKHDMPRLATDVLTTFAVLDRDGPVAEVTAGLGDAIAKAQAAGARAAELRARYLLARYLQDRGDFAESGEAFAAAAARGAEFGTPWAPYAFEARVMQVWVLQAVGRWDEALALASLAGESPPALAEAMLTSERAVLLAWRGAPEALELARGTSSQWQVEGLVALTAWSAELAVHEHHLDAAAALAAYDDAVATVTRLWRPWFAARLRLAATTLGVLASAAGRLSAEERSAQSAAAARLFEDGHRVVAHHREAGVEFGPEGAAWATRLGAEMLRWRWAAQLDPPGQDELLAAWHAAEDSAAAFGHVPELARVRVRLASVLRASGDAVGARRAGDAARGVAQALGARSLLDELVALGSAPGRAAPSHGGALTAREREILALVAEGRTNGEIGRQLFISTKTVSVHVSNILAKLGAAGRTEAAALARRQGLLD